MNLEPLVPQGRILGREFARSAGRILRHYWRPLLPAALTLAALAAALQCALAVWTSGSFRAAASRSFAIEAPLVTWLEDPLQPVPSTLPRILIALVITGILLPTVITVAAAVVVIDAVAVPPRSRRSYAAPALKLSPQALATTALITVISITPAVSLAYVAWVSRAEGRTMATLAIIAALPAVAWALFSAIRLSLAVQISVAEDLKPTRAAHRSWQLTRGHTLRVLAITLLTNLCASALGSVAAAPFTLLGTLSALDQREPTSGRRLVEAFINGTVGSTVSLAVAGVIVALLTIDLVRSQSQAH